MLRKSLSILLLLFFTVQFSAQSDSIVSKRSLFIIPHASYQQETSWAPGIAFGYYFKSTDLSRISSISGSVVYTFRNQFMVNVSPKLYFKNKDWYLYSNLNIKNYPDYYYGIGNHKTDIKEAFTSRIFSFLLQPQYEIIPHLYIGPNVLIRFERIIRTDSIYIENEYHGGNYAISTFPRNKRYGYAGLKPYHLLNTGAVIAYDTRDNSFYPYQGIFIKASYGFGIKGIANTYSLQQTSLDFRQYFSFFNNHIIAFQFRFYGIFGKKIPFQMLSTLGGSDLMRGFRENQFKDNIMMALQSEYRFPILWRFKGAVFCGAGNVFNNSNFQTNKLKFIYGAGLRCQINQARVHIRFDIAKNNYGDKLQFYITATEAF